MENELREAVLVASTRADVREVVEAVYQQLQVAIDARRPICTASGRCCHFDQFGHRLYVTTMELAKFDFDLSVVRGPSSVVRGPSSVVEKPKQSKTTLPLLTTDYGQLTKDKRDCPFQIDRLCSVHTIRPFGCRIFFCDETATDWQHEQYEQHHNQLRRMHEELDVPYFYVEWRAALRALQLMDVAHT